MTTTEAKFSYTKRFGQDLFTARGDTIEEFKTNFYAMDEFAASHNLIAPKPAPAPQPVHNTVNQAQAPAPAPSGELSIACTNLGANMKDGKTYWKVKGGRFTQHGITVWPEVLEAAGMKHDQMNPMSTYNLTGWTAYYILGDTGNPLKVTRLVSTQAPAPQAPPAPPAPVAPPAPSDEDIPF